MTNNRINRILLTGLLLLLGLPSFAKTGGQNGDGGGGISENGVYKTFYSAGVYVEAAELRADQVPELNGLSKLIMTLPEFKADIAAQYFRALMPSKFRKYYKVKADKFTTEERDKLVGIYSKLMGVDPSKVTLFAVTDKKTYTTYLLPEFFALTKTSEQAAILFHESYWLVNNEATYEEVLAVEASLQEYLESKSPPALMNWLDRILSVNDMIWAGYASDTKSGALASIVGSAWTDADGVTYHVSLEKLLGPISTYTFEGGFTNESQSSIALQYLYGFSLNQPDSQLLQTLISKLGSGNRMRICTSSSVHNCSSPRNTIPAKNCYLYPHSNSSTLDVIPLRCRTGAESVDLYLDLQR